MDSRQALDAFKKIIIQKITIYLDECEQGRGSVSFISDVRYRFSQSNGAVGKERACAYKDLVSNADDINSLIQTLVDDLIDADKKLQENNLGRQVSEVVSSTYQLARENASWLWGHYLSGSASTEAIIDKDSAALKPCLGNSKELSMHIQSGLYNAMRQGFADYINHALSLEQKSALIALFQKNGNMDDCELSDGILRVGQSSVFLNKG